MRFKSHGNFHSLNTATFACIPPFFYSSRSVWKHQRWSEILFFSLSLVVGSRAISLSAYSCTHMHRSWMRTAFLASWQCARASAYLDYKPFILPFLFLPPFSSQSRRFISTLIRCATKSLHPRIGFFLRVQLVFFTLEIIRDGLFDVTFRHYYILYIYRLVFPLSFNYRNRERINNALQLNSPSSKRSRLFIHLTDYLNTRPSFHSLARSKCTLRNYIFFAIFAYR